MSSKEVNKNIYENFFKKFCDEEPRPWSLFEIHSIEKKFKITFPEDYKDFLLRFGAINCDIFHPEWFGELKNEALQKYPDLDIVSDQSPTYHSVCELLPDSFFSPTEVLSLTNMYHQGGMSPELISVAGDDMGNCLCFSQLDGCLTWFDHDYVSKTKLPYSWSQYLEHLLEYPSPRPFTEFYRRERESNREDMESNPWVSVTLVNAGNHRGKIAFLVKKYIARFPRISMNKGIDMNNREVLNRIDTSLPWQLFTCRLEYTHEIICDFENTGAKMLVERTYDPF